MNVRLFHIFKLNEVQLYYITAGILDLYTKTGQVVKKN